MTNFTKTSPGFACNQADKLGATWHYLPGKFGVQEARLADGTVIAYCEGSKFYISEEGSK